ncbi:Calx-beta domain-containing protein, partial [Microcoleus sp. BR0-C5]|uniref:Calx-beta domain-containing protein n=1 Tax=Microcoleus sp. BR0-C5 TaxID=2818713 RepID=UPI002FD52C13
SPETVNLVLFGGNVSNPSILTINDVPPAPMPTSPSLFQFAQPNYTVAEGNPVTINVTRTGGTAAASINYATLDGSASSPADYTGTAAGVLDFPAGVTTASFTVTALSDMIAESPETVNLVLLGGNVGSTPSILTINDVPPTGTATTPAPTPVGNTYFFSQDTYSANEGESVLITINRSGDLSQPSVIFFGTGDSTAQSTNFLPDYFSASQGIFFAPGQTSVGVGVQTYDDNFFNTIPEPPETVNLFLTGGSLASPSQAVLSIIDPDFVAPTVFFYGSSPDSIIDGGFGGVTINRTGNTSVSAVVDYLIAPAGGAPPVLGQDYNLLSSFPVTSSGGTVNFNAGETSVSLAIYNRPGLTGGPVNLSFGPNTSLGTPTNTTITLL